MNMTAMENLLQPVESIQQLCQCVTAEQGVDEITAGINRIYPELDFGYTLTRGHWYRLGGVVDADHQPVAESLEKWLRDKVDDDLESVLLDYADKDYFITINSGKTHYFCAQTGDRAQDYIQIEIEQLQQVIDRPLVDPDWMADSIEEFIDPVECPRLERLPVGEILFQFRRVTEIDRLIDDLKKDNWGSNQVPRFVEDWNRSSAPDATHFSEHWVLSLREYMDSDKQVHRTAKPVPACHQPNVELPDGERYSGADLAHAIHSYDRQVGYPFSWFFMMISRKSDHIRLADAVLNDLMGAYDYLPSRDLKILRDWAMDPYAI